MILGKKSLRENQETQWNWSISTETTSTLSWSARAATTTTPSLSSPASTFLWIVSLMVSHTNKVGLNEKKQVPNEQTVQNKCNISTKKVTHTRLVLVRYRAMSSKIEMAFKENNDSTKVLMHITPKDLNAEYFSGFLFTYLYQAATYSIFLFLLRSI